MLVSLMKKIFLIGFILFCSVQLYAQPLDYILDMVHHNPGEPLFESKFNNPSVLKNMGYNGKVFFLFDAAPIAIDWQSVDPDIFPKGSEGRKWVDKKAARLDSLYSDCESKGLDVYCMADLILFPKTLIEKYKLNDTFGDISNTKTEYFLRKQMQLMFDRFPQLDGLVVRIGETYLQDAPYHDGSILNKSDADKTIIPLMNILRDEICVKANKKLIFRTWLSFDVDASVYQKVSDNVEPHENLLISVKHVEGDFHRGHSFSKVLGMGRHKQLVEIQCAREYEGKGAYPNYIADGVIDGFEEHQTMTETSFTSIREFYNESDLLAGIWTWTKGGGWEGPYIDNELWPEVNAWVLARWANDPSAREDSLAKAYAIDSLGLTIEQAQVFYTFLLNSASAILRFKSTTANLVDPWWSRDEYISFPVVPDSESGKQKIRDEFREAVELSAKNVAIAESLAVSDMLTKDYIVSSSYYGLYIAQLFEALMNLNILINSEDKDNILQWLQKYDRAWNNLKGLHYRFPGNTATLYKEKAERIWVGTPPEQVLPKLRCKAGNCENSQYIDSTSFIPYPSNQGSIELVDNHTFSITEGAHIALPYALTITPSTFIEFEFKSSSRTVENSIGFTDNLEMTSGKRFHLFGEIVADGDLISEFKNYSGDSKYKAYKIKLSDFLSGKYNFISFITGTGDDFGNATFRNIRIYEDSDEDGMCDDACRDILVSLNSISEGDQDCFKK
jgi:hypothetical protein